MSKSMTVAQLIAAAQVLVPSMNETKIREVLKAENVKSQKRITEVFGALAAKANRPSRIRTTRVVEAGPRGFTFKSKAWQDSVATAEGIAVHPYYLPKLKAHAKELGLNYGGMQPAEICASIMEAQATRDAEAAKAEQANA